jgi:hypothetical protein
MTAVSSRRHQRVAAWITLFMFAVSPLCSAQTAIGGDQPAGAAAQPQIAPWLGAGALPRSRRTLTTEEFATLVGQTLGVSVRDRWPRRVVTGTILGVTKDAVSVDTGKAIRTLPIAKTLVTTSLPGDFVELIGRKVTVSGDRRFPPRETTGIVVSVDATNVNIDSEGQLQRVPIASSVILSRTPDRDRRRAIIAAVAVYVGSQVWLVRKCRNGGC